MPRPIWKGTLGFGLVTIGVELHAALAPDELDLDLLDRRDHARIRYQKINESTGRPVALEDIVKGFAVGKGRYVVLSDAELKAANPTATQTVDIHGFVPVDAIEAIYFAKPYYVAPRKGSERAYALLREALRKTAQMALAQIVVRTRQYVAAVYPYQGALVVHLLRYHTELRDPESFGLSERKLGTRSVRPQEIGMAEQLMGSMAMAWKPEEYSDTYHRDILKLVKQRARGGARSRGKAAVPEPEAEEPPRVLDLMAALKRSMASRGRSNGRPHRAATHRRSVRKTA